MLEVAEVVKEAEEVEAKAKAMAVTGLRGMPGYTSLEEEVFT